MTLAGSMGHKWCLAKSGMDVFDVSTCDPGVVRSSGAFDATLAEICGYFGMYGRRTVECNVEG